MEHNRKLRIVIADRDKFYLQKLKNCLERKGEMVVIGMTDNGADVFQLVKEKRPDVILLDTVLGEKDGVWVLEQIRKLRICCITIMITAIDNDLVVRRAIVTGADYYMIKPIQGDLLIERICQLAESKNIWSTEKEEPVFEIEESATQKVNSLEAEISTILNSMGIQASIKGYHFIRQAVMMAVEDREVLAGITKGLYPDLAKMYHTTASKVERAIRHAIESAWKKNGQEVYLEISGYQMEDKPTNGQFIAALTEYFRMKQHQTAPLENKKETKKKQQKEDANEMAFFKA